MSDRADQLIDAEELLASTSVAELAFRADELVRSMLDPSALLAKPCSSLREAPDLLACFGLLLNGLAPLPGMTVLDFGAGSCWTSHFLTQLGCRVIAMDISVEMLGLGERRYREQPVFGDQPGPEFKVFNGTEMALDDESVDRILCFDALHHVDNIPAVLAEMGRVLKPGGSAGFSEPGPSHSKDPQSQHEMRRYGVPERDLVLEDIWASGAKVGFSDVSVAIFAPAPEWVSLDGFNAFVSPKAPRMADRVVEMLRPRGHARLDRLLRPLQRISRLGRELADPRSARAGLAEIAHVRGQLANRRMFILRKEGPEIPDSREVTGLRGDLHLHDLEVDTGASETVVSGSCGIVNTGANRWLASSAGRGAVLLGLRVRRGSRPSADHGRVALPGDRVVAPGETLNLQFSTELATPAADDDPVVLELDLVSEGISWFAEVQGHPIEIPVPAFES
jgi:SAM-dependent methyltransferase